MIRAEYPKVYQYLHGELEKHLAILESEGRMIFQRLQRNVIRMIHTRKLMISIYEGLKKLYQKTDVDLLQVRTQEGWQGNHWNPLKFITILTSITFLDPNSTSSDCDGRFCSSSITWRPRVTFALHRRRKTTWKVLRNRSRTFKKNCIAIPAVSDQLQQDSLWIDNCVLYLDLQICRNVGCIHSFYFEGLDLELTPPSQNFRETSANLARDCNKAQPFVHPKNIFWF